jgi:hypothetical protein
MKRVLVALAIGGAALATAPAHASESPVQVQVTNDANQVGVGVLYGTNGHYLPLGGVFVNKNTGRVCFGLSYQVPFCTPGLS